LKSTPLASFGASRELRQVCSSQLKVIRTRQSVVLGIGTRYQREYGFFMRLALS
jgi:hypothetical protein